jgi:hypothetical protein
MNESLNPFAVRMGNIVLGSAGTRCIWELTSLLPVTSVFVFLMDRAAIPAQDGVLAG